MKACQQQHRQAQLGLVAFGLVTIALVTFGLVTFGLVNTFANMVQYLVWTHFHQQNMPAMLGSITA